MAKFIEVHQQGEPRLINLTWVEDIWPTGNGTQIFIAFNDAGDTSQDYIPTDESFEEIRALIFSACGEIPTGRAEHG